MSLIRDDFLDEYPIGKNVVQKQDVAVQEVTPEVKPELTFTFSSGWLNSMIETVTNHTTANSKQVSVKALQNVAYLFSYGGMVRHSLPFYALDLSPTGTGKTEVVKKCRQLLLSPIFKMQEEAHKNDLERYQEESQAAKGKEREFVAVPKLHKCIHVTDTSPEALFESFEAQKAQVIEMGELGRKLKSPKHQSLIDYVIEGHGAAELAAPNYKNQRFSKVMKIEHPQLCFHGDTNLRYMSKSLFFEHLEGGLLNRCLMVYNPSVPEFEELPTEYSISEFEVSRFNDIATKVIDFAKVNQNSNFSIDREVAKERKRYERKFYNMRKSLMDSGSSFANLYARAIQNFRAIANTLHLIKCFDRGVMLEYVEPSTVKEAYEFCMWQFESYKLLMDEVGGIMDEIRADDRQARIIQYIEDMKLPISFREVQRKFNIKKVDVEKAIARVFKQDGTNILYRL